MTGAQLEYSLARAIDLEDGWSNPSQPRSVELSTDSVVEYLEQSIRLSQSMYNAGEACEADAQAWEEEYAEVEIVAAADAGYAAAEGVELGVMVISTAEESDFFDAFFTSLEECGFDAYRDQGYGVSAPARDLPGIVLTKDDPEDPGVLIVGGTSYGHHHILVQGGSLDPQDEQVLEEMIERIHNRFEEGPQNS